MVRATVHSWPSVYNTLSLLTHVATCTCTYIPAVCLLYQFTVSVAAAVVIEHADKVSITLLFSLHDKVTTQ